MNEKNKKIIDKIRKLAAQIVPDEYEEHEICMVLIVADCIPISNEVADLNVESTIVGCRNCILPPTLQFAFEDDEGLYNAANIAVHSLGENKPESLFTRSKGGGPNPSDN